MARGAAAPGAGAAPAGSPAPAGDGPATIPEKYIVKNEDGTPNWEASALKQAQGYAALAQRMGAGEAPPKDADSYAPELPQGVTMDALKGDPLYAGFLKGAHAKGLNNSQVGWLLGQFQERMSMATAGPDPAVAEAELSQVWKLPGEMDKNLSNSYRAAHAFAADKEHAARLEQKFGNDPDFIRLMAKIGGELGEDTGAPQGISSVEQETLESLISSPAYMDAKHPDHAKTVAKTRALYAKKYPENA